MRSNVRGKIIKLLEETLEYIFMTLQYRDFSNMTQKWLTIKAILIDQTTLKLRIPIPQQT